MTHCYLYYFNIKKENILKKKSVANYKNYIVIALSFSLSHTHTLVQIYNPTTILSNQFI